MGRPAKVWKRKADGWWCCTIGGKKVRLSQDKKEAEKQFHAMKATEAEESGPRPTFRRVADDFLSFSKGENPDKTFQTHRTFLQSFCDHIKARRAPDLRPEHVREWLKANPTWGKSTRSLAVQIVKAALNHAVTEKRLVANPLKAVKQGTFAHRTRILTEGEREKIRARVTGTFKDFMFALEQTGARPSEVAGLEARMIDWEDGSVDLENHKNKKHGLKRIIYFTPETMALLRRLAAKHPVGLLFRTRHGTKWDTNNAHRWTRVFARELGIKEVFPYAFRHSFINDAIVRGVPLPVIAELVGNSVDVLIRHYVHLAGKKDALKAAAVRAVSQ
jgi:integrase